MKMKNYIIIAIVIVLFIGGYFVYQNISKTSTLEIQPELQLEVQTQPDETNGIYTVDELVESNIQEGVEVFVSGRYNAKLISADPDYEGLGSGDYLFGETKAIHLMPQLENVELNEIIIVKGKVRYCGGKKVDRFVCGLIEVEKTICAKKGEFVNPDDLKGKTRYPDVCCAGLTGLMSYIINDKGECEGLEGTPYLTCMPCGNGICEKSESNRVDENKCNCPEDCQNE